MADNYRDGKDQLRDLSGKSFTGALQQSQMNTAQGIADYMRKQGGYKPVPGINRQQYDLPVDHPDATVGDK